jgi:8-oxo-dGTP pyrophosphatase MutT (NUDIX family)
MSKQTDKLIQYFKKPLPGIEVQRRMAPSVRFTGKVVHDEDHARKSSVLILLYQKRGQWYIPLIQRPTYDGAHSGQVSLPGGKTEEWDRSYLDTALRESQEEIGIEPKNIQYIGALSSLYIPNSNFIVYPQVCMTSENVQFTRDTREVESIIEVPLSKLIQPETIQRFQRTINGIGVDAPYYKIDEYIVWGATAMMLSEFLYIIEKSGFLTNPLSRSCSAYSVPECR